MKLIFKYLLVVLLPFVLAGCNSAKLALREQNWNSQPEYVVQGRQGFTFNQKLKFGEFATDKIKRSWTTTKAVSRYYDFSNITADFIKRHQAYSFTIQDTAGRALTISSAINVAKTDRTWTKGRSASSKFTSSDILKNNLYIIITNPDDESDLPWQLTLDNNAHYTNQRHAGTLYQTDQDYYYFVPVTKIKGSNGSHQASTFDVSGYEIFNQDNQPVAAVSLIDKGAVYFKTQAPAERLLLAGVCSALLLQPHDIED
ncbi:hypothetical protein [Mucilaginibacter lacusdianchii]|uniref:hypothetical protein n=1 Tax=Mucilaginibacter lacusdianchii TaxID=2684211 RepID=UPI00131CCC9E|nr:hypothetical protein [Mucilaginibacter sp. JXJ CY 39]